MVMVEETGKAKEETTDWVNVSKEGENEYGEAGEGCLFITQLFDWEIGIVLEELGSVVHGL